MIMKIKKYAIYARSSSEVDQSSKSIKFQIKTLQEVAEKRSLDVIRLYEETGSAKAKDRPCFDLMIQSLKKGQIQGILCMSIDRLTRDFSYAFQLAELLRRNKLEIVTPSMSITDAGTVIIELLLSAMALMDSEDRSERIKKGMALRNRKATMYMRVSSKLQEDNKLRR